MCHNHGSHSAYSKSGGHTQCHLKLQNTNQTSKKGKNSKKNIECTILTKNGYSWQ